MRAPENLSRASLPPVALYVHIPFCVSHCPYCDFVVYAGAEARGPRARTEALYDAVERELELRADALDTVGPGDASGGEGSSASGRRADALDASTPVASSPEAPAARPPLESLYFGGGTPSLVPAARLQRLIETVRRRFGLAGDAEVTLEANPGPDERGDLAGFVAAGVNRISFGAQSMDAAELRRLGRRHSPWDVATALADARRAGIASVNLDLLYDIPGQSLESWQATLQAATELQPDHLSLYALTLDDPDTEGLTGETGDHLPTAPGARRWRDAAAREQDDERAATEYLWASETLAARGWRGYEISNWAKPGHESRHNLAYWQRRPYEAVGPGAHAFDGATRRWNAANLDRYMAALLPAEGEPQLPPGGSEAIDSVTARGEELILALRLDSGLPAEAAETDGSTARTLDWALSAGLLEPFESDGRPRLRLTVRGRLLSNELFARLL